MDQRLHYRGTRKPYASLARIAILRSAPATGVLAHAAGTAGLRVCRAGRLRVVAAAAQQWSARSASPALDRMWIRSARGFDRPGTDAR